MIVSPFDAEPIASWIVENVPGTLRFVALAATPDNASKEAAATVAFDSHLAAKEPLERIGD